MVLGDELEALKKSTTRRAPNRVQAGAIAPNLVLEFRVVLKPFPNLRASV